MKQLLNLVGISHALHARAIVPLLSDGTPLLLVPEPDNKYDKNAIQVWVRVGYIKASQSQDLAPKLQGKNHPAMIANAHHSYAEIEVDIPEPEDQSHGIEPDQGPSVMGGQE